MNQQIIELNKLLFEGTLITELSVLISKKIGQKLTEEQINIEIEENPRLRTSIARMGLEKKGTKIILTIEVQSWMDSMHIQRDAIVPILGQFLGRTKKQIEALQSRLNELHRQS